ncbi:hypothetical protein GGS21DRAFT_89706 [Xylaria nigripes]|nr:hypothetical protein GGS21DRAFT_89706 [Xylaria nigripes]
MAPVQSRKRKSEAAANVSPQRSPIKKRRTGITLAQKQALVDNLQLEITERARRLRAQYNVQAQHLRSRVEMRVNRIPRTLRKLRLDELPSRPLPQIPQQPRPAAGAQHVTKPPPAPAPIPAKDPTSPKPISREPIPITGETDAHKRLRNENSGADKENRNGGIDLTKKRPRAQPTHANASMAASQVLSPTSSNTRILPRDPTASPTKPTIGRPISPVKPPGAKASSNILSSIVDKAKVTRPALTTQPATTSSAGGTNAGAASTTATGRARKAAAPSSTATTRGRRKASVTSQSSEESTSSEAKKTSTTASRVTKTAPAAKKTVMNTIRSATTKKAPATKAATAGRTLRKRN